MGSPITLTILDTGEKTAANGVKVNFDEEMLSQIQETYDPNKFKAPLIISHKTRGVHDNKLADSEFAYGFPTQLRKIGNRVQAVFDKLNPQVTQWYRDGNLLSLSPSFYTPDSPHNPTPGKWHLRHIAMLGATPPAIKTLSPIELEEGEEGVVTFEFSEDTLDFMCDECGLSTDYLTRIREWIIEDKGKDKADSVLPLSVIESLRKEEKYEAMEMERLHEEIERLREQVFILQNKPIASVNYGESSMNLKSLMSDAGMSVSDVAEATGIDEKLLQMYVSGKKKPTKAHSSALMDLLGDMEDDKSMDYAEIDRLSKRGDRIEDDLDQTNNKVIDLEEQLARLQDEIINLAAGKAASDRRAKELEDEFLEYQETQKREEITRFVDHLHRESVLTPAQTGLRAINFGEGEETEYDLVSFLESLDEERYNFMTCFLSDLPPQADFNEYSAPEDDVPTKAKKNGHYASHSVDTEKLATREAILQFAEQKGLSFADAYPIYFAQQYQ